MRIRSIFVIQNVSICHCEMDSIFIFVESEMQIAVEKKQYFKMLFSNKFWMCVYSGDSSLLNDTGSIFAYLHLNWSWFCLLFHLHIPLSFFCVAYISHFSGQFAILSKFQKKLGGGDKAGFDIVLEINLPFLLKVK